MSCTETEGCHCGREQCPDTINKWEEGYRAVAGALGFTVSEESEGLEDLANYVKGLRDHNERLQARVKRIDELYQSSLGVTNRLQAEREALLDRVKGALLGIEAAEEEPGHPKQPWLCWEDSPLQLCPCGKTVEPRDFLMHLNQCEVGTEHYAEMIKKINIPAAKSIPKFTGLGRHVVKGRGTILIIDMDCPEGKKLERLLNVKAIDSDAVGQLVVEVDGKHWEVTNIERSSGNTLANLVVKET